MSMTVWSPDGDAESVISKLAGWQGGWTIFYWAWLFAFATFVGLFFARISKGRTIREYVLDTWSFHRSCVLSGSPLLVALQLT